MVARVSPPPTSIWCRPSGARATQILVGRGLLPTLGTLVDETCGPERPSGRHWVWDRTLEPLGFAPEVDAEQGTAMEAGEALKSLARVEDLLRILARRQLDRRAELVAVGGGSLGDFAGLAASLYLRGIDVVQVPTTLLAMIDSSVGGKTAVNLPEGKNLVGSVHPPRLVIADMDTLTALPESEFRSGLGEALKMAIGLDRELFELLERDADRVLGRDPDSLREVVVRSIEGKVRVVEADLRESGPRQVLNLGHTWGHALEIHAAFSVPHGVAVARGIHVVLDIARDRGALSNPDHERCRGLLERYGFARDPLPPHRELEPFLARDKKVRDGDLHLVLPTGVGRCEVAPVPLAALPEGR